MVQRPILKPRCAHCRRRKIKCDYVRPRCGNCARVGIECVYESSITIVAYQPTPETPGSTSSERASSGLRHEQPLLRPLVWATDVGSEQELVDEKQLKKEHHGQKSLLQPKHETRQHQWHKTQSEEPLELGSRRRKHLERRSPSWQGELKAASARRWSVGESSVSLLDTAHLDGARDQFVNRFLPRDKTSWAVAHNWLVSWFAVAKTHRVAQTAGQALHVQLMAQELGDVAKLQAALTVASRAFSMLGAHLSTANTIEGKKIAFISAATMLSTDVILICIPERIPRRQGSQNNETDPLWWLAHADGVTTCLQVLGIEALGQGPLFDIFCAMRPMLTGAAVLKRKRTILSSPEWKLRPRGNFNIDFFHKLTDILLNVPIIETAADCAIEATNAQERENALDEFVRTEAETQRQLADSRAEIKGTYGYDIDLRHSPLLLVLAAPRLTFAAAMAVLSYHACLLAMHVEAKGIIDAGTEIPERHRDFFAEASEVLPFLPVAQVLTLVATFCTNPEHGIAGKLHASVALLPLGRFFSKANQPELAIAFQQLLNKLRRDGFHDLAKIGQYTTSQPGQRRAAHL